MSYIVTGPVAVLNISGDLKYFYEGTPLPAEGYDEEHLDALIELGLVAEVEDVVVVAVDEEELAEATRLADEAAALAEQERVAKEQADADALAKSDADTKKKAAPAAPSK